MKPKTLMILAIALGLVFLLGDVSWAGGRIGHRQVKQHKRIAQGIRSGQVTDREYVRLNGQQSRIHQYKRHAWADGYLSPKERHRLHRMQDRASEHIYHAKHIHMSYAACRPTHKHLHFSHPSVYDGFYLSGTVVEPSWAFGWSVGWR